MWDRWDYANDGYLDALKHLTDLKEEGKGEGLYLSPFCCDCLFLFIYWAA